MQYDSMLEDETTLRDGRPPRQGVKNSEMPLAECAAYRDSGGAAVLIGTEDLVQALDHGFHGFVTGAHRSWAAACASLSSAPRSLQI